MSTPPAPHDGTERPADGDGTDHQPPTEQRQPEQPAYYRPGPSTGHYPQYPQNPYGPGRSGVPPQLGGTQPGPSAYGQTHQYGGYEGPTYPYGGPYSADTGSFGAAQGTAGRPRSVVVGFLLLLVAPALFVLIGLALALAPLSADMFPPEAGVDAALSQSGLTMDQLLSALRTFGAVMVVLAVLYAALAVVTFLGKLGALITLTVLTVLFDLFWLVALLSAAANPVGAILPVIVLGGSAAGVWLMFTPPARAWFAARRG